MPNYNHVTLIGNVVRDPDTRYTPKGTAVTELSLAINRTYTGEAGQKKEETTYIDITLWGKVAEVAQKYVKKGNPLFVEGRLKLDSWQDKQTNQPRSKLSVIGENIQLLTRPQAEHGEPTPTAALLAQRQERERQAGAPSRVPTRNELDEPDEIPF